MKLSNFKRKRKPIIALICEGKNQTESKFFNHFNTRENNYNLKIIPSEATDPNSMAKKAKRFIDEMQLDSKLGDKVYCVIDISVSHENHLSSIVLLYTTLQRQFSTPHKIITIYVVLSSKTLDFLCKVLKYTSCTVF